MHWSPVAWITVTRFILAILSPTCRNQNSLARVMSITSKYEHIILVLKLLHWLHVQQESFKLELMVDKTSKYSQPQYLKNCPCSSNLLLFNKDINYDCFSLVIPKTRTVPDKLAFSVAGTKFWHSDVLKYLSTMFVYLSQWSDLDVDIITTSVWCANGRCLVH